MKQVTIIVDNEEYTEVVLEQGETLDMLKEEYPIFHEGDDLLPEEIDEIKENENS